MSSQEIDNGVLDELSKQLLKENHRVELDNGDEADDQLVQVLAELSFQNDYLKSQIRGFSFELESSVDIPKQINTNFGDGGASEQLNTLSEKIKSLNKELQEQKETQKAAENALEHLRQAYTDADSKVQELSRQLSEAHKKMEQEIKERDDKYVELDTKFGRLHKRAKQRIQELQKENDDLEARLRDVNALAEQASTQQTLAQQELERARQHASEALRSMDSERQQLRTTNSKLRDNIDEMRHSVESKVNELETLQQSLLEKEQTLGTVRGLLQAAEEKRQALAAELSAKHQKLVESLEAQLADALSDRSKAAESISSLQMLVAEKDTKIAELDAASTGEAVRLGAALEEVRGELNNLKDQHENERQIWEATCQSLRTKLETSENACVRSEIEAAKLRSQLELGLSTRSQMLNNKDAEIAALQDEIILLQSEFSAYKVRAHALLQKKDAELSAAKHSDVIKAQEEAIREAEKEVAQALAERDKAIQNLRDALAKHEKEIAAREAALNDVEQEIRAASLKLESATSQFLREKETWKKILESTEESWKLKYGSLEAQKSAHVGDERQKDFEHLKLHYEKLKEEHATFQDIADRAMEEKEKEITKLVEENKKLQQFLEHRPVVNNNNQDSGALASGKQDSQSMSIAAAEQQILLLARQQAQREEELSQSQRHILALQEEIEELERENRLHSQQEAMLKAELRNMERSQKREGVDMTYLKNVIFKLLETGEVEALLPVIGTLLQFSPEEIRKCQQAYRASADASSPASVGDSSVTSRSLFSRFSF